MQRLLDKDLAHAERCMRDIVALSTLPSLWLGADTARMAESLAAALFTTVGPAVVYVALREDADEAPVSVAQVDRYRTDPAVAASIGPRILEWAAKRDPDELLFLQALQPGTELRFAVRPVGFSGRLGVIAAGFDAKDAPSALQTTMLGIGATQAAIAVQNAKLVRSLRQSIAERERVEEALREADRRKDEFIATLSHELRNPLAAITTAVQLVRLRGAGARELGTLERQSAHLTRLVDDLLDISRIARGKIQLRRQRVELGAVLAQALEMAAPLMEPRGYRVDVSAVPPRGLAVDADPQRLAQVLYNLLSNAAKYSDPGQPIAVRAWREAGPVYLSVADRGAGIPPDMIDRVFDKFVQQEQTIARSEGGLGLGLAIVRSLVELHGGSVSVHSAGPGKGSEFTIVLPAAAETETRAEPAAVPAVAPAYRGATKRILVVDDNADAGGALAELLKMLGHEVAVAHDGADALGAADRLRPDIALIDIGLPGMDGYEVARRLREQGHRQLLLIAVTGYGLERDRFRSAEAGFSAHLVKPIDLSALDCFLGEPQPALPQSSLH